jgi:hypothetical protein
VVRELVGGERHGCVGDGVWGLVGLEYATGVGTDAKLTAVLCVDLILAFNRNVVFQVVNDLHGLFRARVPPLNLLTRDELTEPGLPLVLIDLAVW